MIRLISSLAIAISSTFIFSVSNADQSRSPIGFEASPQPLPQTPPPQQPPKGQPIPPQQDPTPQPVPPPLPGPTPAPVPPVNADWNCRFDASVSGIGLSFMYGGQLLQGMGNISCVRGPEVAVLPIKVNLISGGWGFDLSIVRSLQLVAVNVQSMTGPAALVGTYNVGITSGATFIGSGINAQGFILVTREGGSRFEIALVGSDAIGLGVRLQGMILNIQAM